MIEFEKIGITPRELQSSLLHIELEIIRLNAETHSNLSIDTANNLEIIGKLQQELINIS